MKADRTYWFGRKRFGIGYGPRTWQGWVAVLIYCVLMLSVPSEIAQGNLAIKVASMAGLSVAFFGVFFWKLDTSK